MIDAHAHMQSREFRGDIEGVMERAGKAGITAIISNGVNYEDSLACLKLSRRFPAVKPAIGLYPLEDPGELGRVLELIRESEPVAVGEIGLDYAFERREWQLEPFREQVRLAMELDLPVCVHSRSAGKYVLRELEGLRAERVLLHGFSGSRKDVRRAVELGYFISIPATVITGRHKRELVEHIPLELIMLETDSPVLSPFGGRNEPANLIYSLRGVAEVKELDEKEVARVTARNARKLFNI